jgi:predicted permease
MAQALQIASQVLPIILLIALGHILRRLRFIPESAIPALKKLAIQLTLPLVVFLSLVELDFQPKYLVLDIAIFLFTIIMLLAGLLVKKLSGSGNLYLPNCFTSYENGMMGYGALAAILGPAGFYPIVIMDLGQTVYFSLVFMPLIGILNRKHQAMEEAANHEGGSLPPRSSPPLTLRGFRSPPLRGEGPPQRPPSVPALQILQGFAASPFVIVSAAALILKATGAAAFMQASPPLAAVLESFRMLSALNTPIMCLVIGYELRIDFRGILKPLGVVTLRLALLLSGAALISRVVIDGFLHLGADFKFALYTMCLLPPFFVSAAAIREEAREERNFALNVISLNIPIFLILFTLMSVLRGQ